MNYWKLGCHWGHGKPDYSDVIFHLKIGVFADYTVSNGDVVLITDGHTGIAVGTVSTNPRPVTEFPYLKDIFEQKGIDYAEWNRIVFFDQLYRLSDSNRIVYKIERGICQIHDTDILRQINSLLAERKGDVMIVNMEKLVGDSKQVIFTGAPGTGKTYLARQIAQKMILGRIPTDKNPLSDEEKAKLSKQLAFVQFHPSYDYTDFVEGLRPEKSDDSGAPKFVRRNGVFKDLCKAAIECGSTEKCVLIIDEINRGDIAKIFGELFFAIDKGYRGQKSMPVKTQYQNLIEKDDVFFNGFYVPENVYIIGTMNDIDRNVESMDFAIRRRFTWREIEPTEESLKAVLFGLPDAFVNEAARRMTNLNAAIVEDQNDLGKDYRIGQAYFKELESYKQDADGGFSNLWNNHISPLIREYLRGIPKAGEIFNRLKEAYEAV